MPKKVFNILPKLEGFKDHLNFEEDYKVHYNAECATFPMTKLELEQLPLLLESYIYFCFVLKTRGSPNSEMWKLKQVENNKYCRVASGYKKGHLPKSGGDEECV
eukprot:11624280-Ditylum_brightwellii.AAC.1